MYELNSITALIQEARHMHTNHDIRFKWIQVIECMILEQLDSGVYIGDVMWCLYAAYHVLDNARQDVHTHSSVKTRLRIAEHFLEKAVVANDQRHDPLRLSWSLEGREDFEKPTEPDKFETQEFEPPAADWQEIPF